MPFLSFKVGAGSGLLEKVTLGQQQQLQDPGPSTHCESGSSPPTCSQVSTAVPHLAEDALRSEMDSHCPRPRSEEVTELEVSQAFCLHSLPHPAPCANKRSAHRRRLIKTERGRSLPCRESWILGTGPLASSWSTGLCCPTCRPEAWRLHRFPTATLECLSLLTHQDRLLLLLGMGKQEERKQAGRSGKAPTHSGPG